MKDLKRKNLIITVLAILFLFISILVLLNFKYNINKDKPLETYNVDTSSTNLKNLNKNQDTSNSNETNQNREDIIYINKSNIIPNAISYAVPANQVAKMLTSGSKNNPEKEIFLTIDDGPSKNTPKILEILKNNGVHATFFILGSNLKDSKENQNFLKEIYNSGNAIGNHTYSHDLKKIYPKNNVDTEVFINEIKKANDVMNNILGNNFCTKVLRMPGGYMSRVYYNDKNLNILNEDLSKYGIISVDWNADSEDAITKNISANKILDNVIKESVNKSKVVVLIHDLPEKTVTLEALPKIIQYFKDKGYSFKVISNPN